MDILTSPLDLSHAGDGYPNISTGHVSCRGWISLHLCWTGLILIKDIHQQTCIILRIWISLVESGTPLYTGDMQRLVHCYILQYPTELCAPQQSLMGELNDGIRCMGTSDGRKVSSSVR